MCTLPAGPTLPVLMVWAVLLVSGASAGAVGLAQSASRDVPTQASGHDRAMAPPRATGTTAAAATADPAAATPTGGGTLVLPTAAEISAAVTHLRTDPNLGSAHSVRSLQWVRSKANPPNSPWILGFFEFLGQTARLLLWIAGSVVAALAVVWSVRLLRARFPRAANPRRPTVSHIGALDIRPASLPDDVGAAALALLEAGRTRDALSLLYRGALSRALHRHGVAIQESFTEGEALRAVESRMDRPRIEYFRDLLGLWQRAIYAGQATAAEPVAALCASFGATLDSVP